MQRTSGPSIPGERSQEAGSTLSQHVAASRRQSTPQKSTNPKSLQPQCRARQTPYHKLHKITQNYTNRTTQKDTNSHAWRTYDGTAASTTHEANRQSFCTTHNLVGPRNHRKRCRKEKIERAGRPEHGHKEKKTKT